ncbi:MAG: hypothetical protein ACRCZZ_09440 [Phocaeicola sp.]
MREIIKGSIKKFQYKLYSSLGLALAGVSIISSCDDGNKNSDSEKTKEKAVKEAVDKAYEKLLAETTGNTKVMLESNADTIKAELLKKASGDAGSVTKLADVVLATLNSNPDSSTKEVIDSLANNGLAKTETDKDVKSHEQSTNKGTPTVKVNNPILNVIYQTEAEQEVPKSDDVYTLGPTAEGASLVALSAVKNEDGTDIPSYSKFEYTSTLTDSQKAYVSMDSDTGAISVDSLPSTSKEETFEVTVVASSTDPSLKSITKSVKFKIGKKVVENYTYTYNLIPTSTNVIDNEGVLKVSDPSTSVTFKADIKNNYGKDAKDLVLCCVPDKKYSKYIKENPQGGLDIIELPDAETTVSLNFSLQINGKAVKDTGRSVIMALPSRILKDRAETDGCTVRNNTILIDLDKYVSTKPLVIDAHKDVVMSSASSTDENIVKVAIDGDGKLQLNVAGTEEVEVPIQINGETVKAKLVAPKVETLAISLITNLEDLGGKTVAKDLHDTSRTVPSISSKTLENNGRGVKDLGVKRHRKCSRCDSSKHAKGVV